MNLNSLMPSEIAAIGGVIDPDANTAATLTTGWVSMATFESVMAIILAGTLGSSATLDAKLEQASDSSGTGAKDITGAAITQLTQAGTDSDKQAVIQCRAQDLDVENSFNHVRLSMTTAVATSDSAALLLGFNPEHAPASDDDEAGVDEIVTV